MITQYLKKLPPLRKTIQTPKPYLNTLQQITHGQSDFNPTSIYKTHYSMQSVIGNYPIVDRYTAQTVPVVFVSNYTSNFLKAIHRPTRLSGISNVDGMMPNNNSITYDQLFQIFTHMLAYTYIARDEQLPMSVRVALQYFGISEKM